MNHSLDKIKEEMSDVLLQTKTLINKIFENNLENEQITLDFLDELNKLSTSW
jgi:hypothetical protein